MSGTTRAKYGQYGVGKFKSTRTDRKQDHGSKAKDRPRVYGGTRAERVRGAPRSRKRTHHESRADRKITRLVKVLRRPMW